MSAQFFSPMDPADRGVLTFDFSQRLDAGELLSGAITVTVGMQLGTDATPDAILNGAASFDEASMKVLVPVRDPQPGAQYAIKVIVDTTNPKKRLALTGVLPVETQ